MQGMRSLSNTILIVIVVIFLIFALRGTRQKVAVLTFAMILAFSSILQQAYSIAWFFLEDGLLLNIGSVTGITAASVIFISLLFQRQLINMPVCGMVGTNLLCQ